MARILSGNNELSIDLRKAIGRLLKHIPLDVRPCDLTTPERLRESLGVCSSVALTIYDQWGSEKEEIVTSAGYSVDILWRRNEKITTGHEIRRRLRDGTP